MLFTRSIFLNTKLSRNRIKDFAEGGDMTGATTKLSDASFDLRELPKDLRRVLSMQVKELVHTIEDAEELQKLAGLTVSEIQVARAVGMHMIAR